jgi:hypothetical protein
MSRPPIAELIPVSTRSQRSRRDRPTPEPLRGVIDLGQGTVGQHLDEIVQADRLGPS